MAQGVLSEAEDPTGHAVKQMMALARMTAVQPLMQQIVDIKSILSRVQGSVILSENGQKGTLARTAFLKCFMMNER